MSTQPELIFSLVSLLRTHVGVSGTPEIKVEAALLQPDSPKLCFLLLSRCLWLLHPIFRSLVLSSQEGQGSLRKDRVVGVGFQACDFQRTPGLFWRVIPQNYLLVIMDGAALSSEEAGSRMDL